MNQLLLATNNPNKIVEIVDILKNDALTCLAPAQLGINLEVVEDGSTYHENAALKGCAFMKASGLVTMADDSGLEVDALGGQPGIFSARFSPLANATDADRRAYLLQRLRPFPPPWTARFRCVIALVLPGGEVRYSEGTCEGLIIDQERGSGGFGYDPIFLLPELGKTMAELSRAQKNQLSHRARAIINAAPIISDIFDHLPPA